MFETTCEAERAEISDDHALAALCADLRTDFAVLIGYGVAFPASATTLLWPFALHLDVERREHDSLCSASRR